MFFYSATALQSNPEQCPWPGLHLQTSEQTGKAAGNRFYTTAHMKFDLWEDWYEKYDFQDQSS